MVPKLNPITLIATNNVEDNSKAFACKDEPGPEKTNLSIKMCTSTYSPKMSTFFFLTCQKTNCQKLCRLSKNKRFIKKCFLIWLTLSSGFSSTFSFGTTSAQQLPTWKLKKFKISLKCPYINCRNAPKLQFSNKGRGADLKIDNLCFLKLQRTFLKLFLHLLKFGLNSSFKHLPRAVGGKLRWHSIEKHTRKLEGNVERSRSFHL